MRSFNAKRTVFLIVSISLILMIAAALSGPTIAVTQSGSIKTVHIRGVKLLHVHTVPSKVAVGNTFSLQGIVLNNSTATITFANGTCTFPLGITFNGNVMTEPQTATAGSCNAQQVTLKPGEQSTFLSPNHSSTAYRATAPRMTNATMTFKYGYETTGKSPISDSISRVYTFNIQPGTQTTTNRPSSAPSTILTPGVLKPAP
ncbi:MAG: hypothetical protein WAZ77_00815 [Candidatus Nitrosopolaris sp.]|jgi:hypothetical protein